MRHFPISESQPATPLMKSKRFATVREPSKYYVQQARNTDAERKASEIRIRAERRAGQLLIEMKKNGQRDAGGRGKIESRSTTQLKDIGITRDQSSKWQQLAEVPDHEFEAALHQPESKTLGPYRKWPSARMPQARTGGRPSHFRSVSSPCAP